MALQQAIVDQCKWQQVDVGLEVSELSNQPHDWATPRRLLAYNLMSVFRHAVMRHKVHHTLSTLHQLVLAVVCACNRQRQ